MAASQGRQMLVFTGFCTLRFASYLDPPSKHLDKRTRTPYLGNGNLVKEGYLLFDACFS